MRRLGATGEPHRLERAGGESTTGGPRAIDEGLHRAGLHFVAWASIEQGRVHLVPKRVGTDDAVEILGTPDLVVEIVSDSSVRKDTKLLYDAYRRAGVPEHWLVDTRADVVRFEILRLEGGDYRGAADSGRPQTSAIFGRTFELVRRRNRVGGWTYRLVATP